MPKPVEEALNNLHNQVEEAIPEAPAFPELPKDENGNPIAPPEDFKPPFPGGRPPRPDNAEGGDNA